VSDDSPLSRWSRRKALARNGPVPAEPGPAEVAVAVLAIAQPPVAGERESTTVLAAAEAPLPLPLPTLADVEALTRDSDFSRFVLPGVDESVRHAAMSKLFSDPHFNVMDGLDTYIDDYGIADPMPDAMLRRMTQSKVLRLFDDDLPPEASAVPCLTQASPDGVVPPALPQSHGAAMPARLPEPEFPIDEDTALRLQPDDAPGPAGAGPDRPGSRA
jgi:hypothetical protein